MRTHMLLFILLSLSFLAYAQNNASDPYLGRKILDEQIENIKDHGGKIDCTNYWNIAVAKCHLGEAVDSIYDNLYKSMLENPVKFSDLVEISTSFYDNDIKNSRFYKILGEKYLTLVELGKAKAAVTPSQESVITNVVNQKVVDTLKAMMEKDILYRKNADFTKDAVARQKQYLLDSINGIGLMQLYKVYGYPGKSITGDNEFQDYFCLMVEHGQNASGKQKFWLPIIADALKKKELHPSVFKMLLDRIHWIESGKQYFGSHHTVPMESDKNIQAIKVQYGL